MIDREKDHKKAALGQIRGMLRSGSAKDMAEGSAYEEAHESAAEAHAEGDDSPQYHDRPETDKHDASVSNLVMPDHDVGDVRDQNSKDRGGDMSQPSGDPGDRGPRASEHQKASGKSRVAPSIPENVKPGDSVPQQWTEGDKGRGASEVRAREDGMGRSSQPARGGGSPPPGRSPQPSPSEQTKPGNSGPGWAEGDRGRGPSELRARADAAHRTAEGEAGEESMDKDLVAGLVHIAKKYRAP